MSGFRPHRSSADCIGHLASALEEARAVQHPAYLVFLDIHLAFDGFPHDVILQHLRLSGISGRLLRHLTAFLTNRTFRVRVCGVMSDTRPVTQGVPQGSIFSSTLFDLVLAALPRSFPIRFGRTSVHMEIYADDIVLWSVARNKQGSPARAALQHGLNWTVRYLEEQGLRVSSEKTIIPVFSARRHVPFTHPALWLHGRRIGRPKVFKYLGLTIDDRVNWRPAVQHTLLLCCRLLRIMHRLCGASWGN